MAMHIDIPDSVLSEEVGDEVVLLDLDSGQYFGLNEVGARMWALLREHRDTDVVFDRLLEEYEVDETRLRGDLDQLVAELVEHGLVHTSE